MRSLMSEVRAVLRSRVRDEWLASQRAVYTRDGYASAIRRYFGWCDRRGSDVFAVGPADLDDYRDYLAGRGLAASSVVRALSAVRSFYRFSGRDGD